jgi:hypothetical protein
MGPSDTRIPKPRIRSDRQPTLINSTGYERMPVWSLQRIPVELNVLLYVMRGLDPRIHLLTKMMDCRVKPGNDDRDSI